MMEYTNISKHPKQRYYLSEYGKEVLQAAVQRPPVRVAMASDHTAQPPHSWKKNKNPEAIRISAKSIRFSAGQFRRSR